MSRLLKNRPRGRGNFKYFVSISMPLVALALQQLEIKAGSIQQMREKRHFEGFWRRKKKNYFACGFLIAVVSSLAIKSRRCRQIFGMLPLLFSGPVSVTNIEGLKLVVLITKASGGLRVCTESTLQKENGSVESTLKRSNLSEYFDDFKPVF